MPTVPIKGGNALATRQCRVSHTGELFPLVCVRRRSRRSGASLGTRVAVVVSSSCRVVRERRRAQGPPKAELPFAGVVWERQFRKLRREGRTKRQGTRDDPNRVRKGRHSKWRSKTRRRRRRRARRRPKRPSAAR